MMEYFRKKVRFKKNKIYARENIYIKSDLFMAYVKNARGFRYERFNNSKKLSADTF